MTHPDAIHEIPLPGALDWPAPTHGTGEHGDAPGIPHKRTCGACAHFKPDDIGDGFGLGICLVDAPASLAAGSCWPNATPNCDQWSAKA